LVFRGGSRGTSVEKRAAIVKSTRKGQRGNRWKDTLHAGKSGGRGIAELVEAIIDAALLMAREGNSREERALGGTVKPDNSTHTVRNTTRERVEGVRTTENAI
jgi:hypothetical protein